MQRIGYVETSNGRLDLVEDNGRLIWTSQNQGLEAKARRLTPTDGRDATTALNAAQRYFGGFTRRLLATEPVDPAAVADTRLWSQWDRQRHNKAEHYARPLKSSPGQLSFGFGGEHQPGETKVENGTTYVFNQNHRWERADQKEMAPQESHAVDPREDYKANGTKAQAFLAWFGNWLKDPANSSQVVDENGEPSHNLEVDSSKVMEDGSPIVMHHGTRTGGFGTFEPRWGQATTDTQNTNGDDLLYGPGHYFTDDKGIAEDYMNIGDDEFTYSPKFDDAETVSRLRSAVISALDRAQNEEAEGNTGPWGIMGGAPGVFDLKQALKDIDEGNYDSSSLSGEKKDQHDWFKGRGVSTDELFTSKQVNNREIKDVYLNIRKPFDADKGITQEAALAMVTQARPEPLIDAVYPTATPELREKLARTLGGKLTSLADYVIDRPGEMFEYQRFSLVLGKSVTNELLKSAGYDGITHEGGQVTNGRSHRVWIAFEGNQVKAVDNEGTFNPDDNRMKHAKAEHYGGQMSLFGGGRHSSGKQKQFTFGSDHYPGETKVENGVTYVFNQNSRWERADKKEMAPKEATAIDPEQDYQANGTKARAFKGWFGDWEKGEGSKVVKQPTGEPAEQWGEEPIIAVHGTAVGGYPAFDPEKDKGQNIYGKGFYFTEDYDIGEEYMEKDSDIADRRGSARAFVDAAGQPVGNFSQAVIDFIMTGEGLPHPDEPSNRYRRLGVLNNPNWDWASIIALNESGGDAAKFLEIVRSDLTGKKTSKVFNRETGETRWELTEPGGYDYQDKRDDHGHVGTGIAAFIREYNAAAEHLGESTIEADVAPPELFECYMNIRNPMDMGAIPTTEELTEFLASYSASLYMDDILGYDEWKELGTDYSMHSDQMTVDMLTEIKRRMVGSQYEEDAEFWNGKAVKAGDPVWPAMHQTQELSWGDVQFIMTNGQHRGDANRFNDKIRERGHDGITHLGGWNIGTKTHRVWIAFEPEQIKAVDNKGTFDPKDRRMKHAKSSLPSRAPGGVGKKIGGALYVHRNYADLGGDQVDRARGALPADFDYQVVKIDESNGNTTFIASPDFDTAAEPTVGNQILVKADGTTKPRQAGADPEIYHHKWLFVADDYRGFDVEESKSRSQDWIDLDIDKSRIGRKSYWEDNVIPKIHYAKQLSLWDEEKHPRDESGLFAEKDTPKDAPKKEPKKDTAPKKAAVKVIESDNYPELDAGDPSDSVLYIGTGRKSASYTLRSKTWAYNSQGRKYERDGHEQTLGPTWEKALAKAKKILGEYDRDETQTLYAVEFKLNPKDAARASDVLKAGKYENSTVQEVADSDPGYLQWLWSTEKFRDDPKQKGIREAAEEIGHGPLPETQDLIDHAKKIEDQLAKEEGEQAEEKQTNPTAMARHLLWGAKFDEAREKISKGSQGRFDKGVDWAENTFNDENDGRESEITKLVMENAVRLNRTAEKKAMAKHRWEASGPTADAAGLFLDHVESLGQRDHPFVDLSWKKWMIDNDETTPREVLDDILAAPDGLAMDDLEVIQRVVDAYEKKMAKAKPDAFWIGVGAATKKIIDGLGDGPGVPKSIQLEKELWDVKKKWRAAIEEMKTDRAQKNQKRRRRYAKDWTEDDHPRADDGKFGSGGGSSSGASSEFLGTCDRIRKKPGGEEWWQDIMERKQEITKEDFLAAVDPQAVLDDGETFDEYLETQSMDKFYRTDDFLFMADGYPNGFEFFWKSGGETQDDEPADINGLEAKLKADHAENLDILHMSEDDHAIRLEHVRMKEGARGKGTGGAILRELQEYATKKNKPIVLEAEPEARKKKALNEFYKLHGFKPPGRNRDYSLPRHTHIWRPEDGVTKYKMGEAGWQTIGGGAPAYVDDEGIILAGCPGLEGEQVALLDENREEREAKMDAAEDAGWESSEQKKARDIWQKGHDQAPEGFGGIVLAKIGDTYYAFGDDAGIMGQVSQAGDGEVATFKEDDLQHHLERIVAGGHRVAIVNESGGQVETDDESHDELEDVVEEEASEELDGSFDFGGGNDEPDDLVGAEEQEPGGVAMDPGADDPAAAHAAAAEQLDNAPGAVGHLIGSMHASRDARKTGSAVTDQLDADYAKRIADAINKGLTTPDGFGDAWDLSEQLGPGAVGYSSPAGQVIMIPPSMQGQDWEVRYTVLGGDEAPAEAAGDGQDEGAGDFDFGGVEPEPEAPAPDPKPPKGGTDWGGLKTPPMLANAIKEAVGDDPLMQSGLRDTIEAVYNQKTEEVATNNASMDGIMSFYAANEVREVPVQVNNRNRGAMEKKFPADKGYQVFDTWVRGPDGQQVMFVPGGGGKQKQSAIIKNIREGQWEDSDQIPRGYIFDQLAMFAGREYSTYLDQVRATVGESGGERMSDEEALYEGISTWERMDPVPPRSHDDNVAEALGWMVAAEKSAANPSGLTAEQEEEIGSREFKKGRYAARYRKWTRSKLSRLIYGRQMNLWGEEDEQKHPRGADGKFAEKPGEKESEEESGIDWEAEDAADAEHEANQEIVASIASLNFADAIDQAGDYDSETDAIEAYFQNAADTLEERSSEFTGDFERFNNLVSAWDHLEKEHRGEGEGNNEDFPDKFTKESAEKIAEQLEGFPEPEEATEPAEDAEDGGSGFRHNLLPVLNQTPSCGKATGCGDPPEASSGEKIPGGMLPVEDYDKILVQFSGGKDSIASLLKVIHDLQKAGLSDTEIRDKVELWHQRIDGEGRHFMDWPITEGYCEQVAKELGLSMRSQWREGGFEGELNKPEGERSAGVWFEGDDGERTFLETNSPQASTAGRGKYPAQGCDLNSRWCSASLKIDVAARALTNDPRFAGPARQPDGTYVTGDGRHTLKKAGKKWQVHDKTTGEMEEAESLNEAKNGLAKKLLFVSGERREEGGNRDKYLEAELHRTHAGERNVHQWRPVIDWSEKEVWDAMKEAKILPHPAYRLGYGRLSCQHCIFADKNQLASNLELDPETVQIHADNEDAMGHTINSISNSLNKQEDGSYKSPGGRYNVTKVGKVYEVEDTEEGTIEEVRTLKDARNLALGPAEVDDKGKSKGRASLPYSILAKAATGESFVTDKPAELKALAMAREYTDSVLVDDWDYPSGAFKKSGGPGVLEEHPDGPPKKKKNSKRLGGGRDTIYATAYMAVRYGKRLQAD